MRRVHKAMRLVCPAVCLLVPMSCGTTASTDDPELCTSTGGADEARPATRREEARTAARAKKPDLHVDEFGTMVGEPVSNGFVFIDGAYVDAPYVVTRKGLAVFINDKMIQAPAPWPPPQEEPTQKFVDPKLPASVNENTSQFDPVLVRYLSYKSAYIRSHYPKGKALRLLRDVYADLPCVQRAGLDARRPVILIVTWSDGETDRVRLIPFEGRQPVKLDKEGVLKRLESERRMYEERLEKGDYYMFFSEGGKITGGSQGSRELLPRIVSILRSAKSAEAKLREVQQAGLSVVNSESFTSIVTQFSASEQLEKRLQDVVRSRQEDSGRQE